MSSCEYSLFVTLTEYAWRRRKWSHALLIAKIPSSFCILFCPQEKIVHAEFHHSFQSLPMSCDSRTSASLELFSRTICVTGFGRWIPFTISTRSSNAYSLTGVAFSSFRTASIKPSVCGEIFQILTISKPAESSRLRHCASFRSIPLKRAIRLMSRRAGNRGTSFSGRIHSNMRSFE